MPIIKNLSRLGVVLTTLGVIALSFAGRASAATAMVPRSGGGAEGNGHIPITPPAVHTAAVGAIPGWQIAPIAFLAALAAAVAPALPDLRRSVRPLPASVAGY